MIYETIYTEEAAMFIFLRLQVSQKYVGVQIKSVTVELGLNCALNTSVALIVEPPPYFSC